MFTKKHYVAIANIINNSTQINHPKLITKDVLIIQMCGFLKTNNSHFDIEKFKKDCYKN
jgi:hypothetical protein